MHDVPVRAAGGGEGFSDARRAPRRDGFGIVRVDAAASCVDRRIVVEAFEDGADERVRRVGIVQHLRGTRGKIRGLILPGGFGTIGAIVGARLLLPGGRRHGRVHHASQRRVGLRAKVHQRPLHVPDVDVEVVDTDDDVDGLGVVDPPGGRGGERVQLLAPPPPLTLGFGDHLRVELGERGEEAGVADEALALLRVGADGSDQTLETRGVRRGHGE